MPASEEETNIDVNEETPVDEVEEVIPEVKEPKPKPKPKPRPEPEPEPIDPRKDEIDRWVETSKRNDESATSPSVPPVSKENEVREWITASKRANERRDAEKAQVKIPEATVEQSMEQQVSEKFPDSYRVTDWAGHPNYECNKCGFASLDKFKLYAHLIQAHSGIEQDYRGETTHS